MAAGQLNTFLDRLLQYVPEDKKAEARSLYSQASDRATQLETTAAAVSATAEKQNQWWEANKEAVQERDRLRQQLAAGPAAPAAGTMDQNAIQRAIEESSARTLEVGLGLVTGVADIGINHLKEFGEVINTRKLAEDAIAAKMPIDQFYNQSVAERRAQRAEEAIQARIVAAREEGLGAGRKEVMDSLGKSLPFPSPSQANTTTTLSGLRKPADGAANPFSLDAAVATAMDVMNKQAGQ